ncbi:MAG: sigma-70 family RNA polymerase sigma factor [Clostridiales bacterium]|nr:sigma-70 family RNA polymerase sigma factor [Clostridiales bacterium]
MKKSYAIMTQEGKMSKYAKEVNNCLERLKRGDDSQYQALFGITWNHLCVVAKYYLKNKSYCDDVVMEVYERVMKYISSYKEGMDGYNWLCKITQMVAYAFNDKNKIFDNSITVEDTDRTENFTDIVDIKTDVDNILKKLDPESRKIIIGYFYLNFTYEEIGKKLGKTRSAIYKQLKKTLKEIEKLL